MTHAAFLITVVVISRTPSAAPVDRDCFASLAMTMKAERRDEAETSMAEPGPRNLITDVPGLLVGQAEDVAGCTGTTVVLCEAPAAAPAHVRGGAPRGRR